MSANRHLPLFDPAIANLSMLQTEQLSDILGTFSLTL